MKKKILVIGAGTAGCAAVHKLHELDKFDITIVDKADHLGAGVRTNYYGGHPYTFGPRHFFTQNKVGKSHSNVEKKNVEQSLARKNYCGNFSSFAEL